MAVIMTQDHEIVEKPLRAFEFKTKTELYSLPSEDFPIQKFQRYKGPKNPSMPKSEATSKTLPLHVLAKAALSLRKTNHNDFHFLKLLGNCFKSPNIMALIPNLLERLVSDFIQLLMLLKCL